MVKVPFLMADTAGSCAQSFAAGLKEQYFTCKEAIHVYEWGRCTDEYLKDFIAQYCGKELAIGDSFADIVVKNLSSCPGAEYIKTHIGDIVLQTYPEVIEIFFLDVCKTSEINHAMTQLFSRGIPGKSIVIHQDFVHEWLPWIRVTMGYLHEYFEPIGNLMYSFVFLLKKEIPKEVLEYNVWEDLSFDKKVECLERYNNCLQDGELLFINMAKALLYAHEAHYGEALTILQNVIFKIDSVSSVWKPSRDACLSMATEIQKMSAKTQR